MVIKLYIITESSLKRGLVIYFVSCSPQIRWRFSKMPFDIFAKERKVLKA